MNRIVTLVVIAATFAATTLLACAGSRDARGEGLDTSTLPDDIKADYDVFARRCSKCHSLARPLNSGIDDDEFWVTYVARMRRQPGSGINQADSVVILRFLRYFSREQRRMKASGGSASDSSNAHVTPSDSGAPSASPDAPDASHAPGALGAPSAPAVSPAIDGGV